MTPARGRYHRRVASLPVRAQTDPASLAALLDEARDGPPRGSAPHRARRSRVLSPRRDRVPGRGPAGRRGAPVLDRGRGRTPSPGVALRGGRRPARRRDRPVRWRRRHRGRADDRAHPDEQDPRDRSGEPLRRHPAGRHQHRPQGRGRGRGAVLRPGPGELRDLFDRRQPRHERRRAVLREVRADAGLRARPRGRAGRRDRHPDRWQEREGRRRATASPTCSSAARERSASSPRRRSASARRPRRGRRCWPSSTPSKAPATPSPR